MLQQVLAGARAMIPSEVWAPRILSLLRIVLGLILLQYGLAKLFGFPAVEMFENLKWSSLFGIAGFFELIGGSLLILGLFTQPAAFILSGEMAFAYFISHAPPGVYTINVEFAGFRKFRQSGRRVEAGLTTSVNFVLEVGRLSEAVTVQSASSLVRHSTTKSSA